MIYLLIPLVLTSSFTNVSKGLTENIYLPGNHTIVSHYIPAKTILTKEAMVLSIEDFAVLKAEVETAGSACDTRLQELKTEQENTLLESQARCNQRQLNLETSLLKAEDLNKKLSKQVLELKTDIKSNRIWSAGIITAISILSVWAIVHAK